MTKLLGLVGATAGGAIGGWIGAQLGGTMTAFVLSMVGTGAGMYGGARIARHYWG
jgi:uncharacterized membrane protein YeaQ/YmgE (transglycosylase-associated protein family)